MFIGNIKGSFFPNSTPFAIVCNTFDTNTNGRLSLIPVNINMSERCGGSDECCEVLRGGVAYLLLCHTARV